DWRVAKRRYRDERGLGIGDEDIQPLRKKSATNPVDQLDWSKMGFGFGGDESPPKFDMKGNAISSWSKSAKKDPLSIAALQVLIMTAGLARSDALEAKEAPMDKNSKQPRHDNLGGKSRIAEADIMAAEDMTDEEVADEDIEADVVMEVVVEVDPGITGLRLTDLPSWNRRRVPDAVIATRLVTGDESARAEHQCLTEYLAHDNSKHRQHGPKQPLSPQQEELLRAAPALQQRSRETPSDIGSTKKAVVRLAKTRKLGTNTYNIVKLHVDADDGTIGIFMPKPCSKRHLLLAPIVDIVRHGTVRTQVLNVEGRREKLPAREALGTWIPVKEDMELLAVNGELERERVAAWVSKLKKEDAEPLTDEEKLDIGEMEQEDRDLVIALLRQYSGIVEKKTGCPPLARVNVEHHINTGDAAPIMLRRRRHAVAENTLIDKEVDDMLQQGVIEPGQGAWGFPVVIVRKKDGSVRFCIDYRALNAVTLKDVYPLPRVDETLEALHGSQRFSSLDLHSGYWQLGVAASDKPKTAFTTRRGLFQFTRMPFGLCNAPSTFQRLMDRVLRGLTWVCCLVYSDDVIIFTKGSVAQHVVELAIVLERLSEAGLSLKVSKCSFATTRMEYLGHDLTPEGIKPTERLVQAIVDFPTPTDDTQVRRFVALAGYYRRFVPEFGTRMAPLTSLLRKSTKWDWGAAQEEAFAWAKAWLSTKPVLIYPDYRLPFKLTTDASKTGLGVVLSQDQGRGDQPVAYASKVNSPAVAKYGISELECLAVVWAVRLFRPHLYGRHFTIVTDHVALKWLMTAKEPAGRLHRWALTLREYDFTIEYRPGRENHVADALSRGPAAADEEEKEADTSEDVAIGPTEPTDKADNSSGDAETITDHAAEAVIRVAQVQRVEAAELGIVQFTDDDVKREQSTSNMVQRLKLKGSYRGKRVYEDDDGLVKVDIGPLPETQAGNRYVIAAVEYTTRYAVVAAVPDHTAKAIARFLLEKVILVFGPMREIMMDERFHRTWKDMISLYVSEQQDDWDDFLPCALKLRMPAELLRRSRLEYPHSTLDDYHEVLMQDLEKAQELAAVALQKEQARQAMYYNQRNAHLLEDRVLPSSAIDGEDRRRS
ncbi:Gag-pol fusion protein, partial [Phytophthora palmivora]